MPYRRRLLIVSLGLLVALGVLIYSAFAANAMYYLTTDEVLARVPELANRPFRLSGDIVPDSVTYDIQTTLLRMQLSGEGGGTIWVEYRGVRPDNLDRVIKAIAEGSLDDRGVFVATKLMLTCPSKYESAPGAAGN